MPVLTHATERIQLVNLGYLREGKGPYAIRQEGYPPGSMNMQNYRYFLLADGSWMLSYAFFLLSEEDQEKHLFGSLKEVFAAIDRLAGKKLVVHSELPEGSTPESIIAGLRKTGSRIVNRLREAKAGRLDPDLR